MKIIYTKYQINPDFYKFLRHVTELVARPFKITAPIFQAYLYNPRDSEERGVLVGAPVSRSGGPEFHSPLRKCFAVFLKPSRNGVLQ
jgi:hypothetical protein